MRVLSESIYRYAEIRYAYGEHRATRWLLTVLVQFFLPRYALVSPHQWGFLVRLFPLLLRRRTRPLLLILVFRGSSVCFHSSSHLSFSSPLSLSFFLSPRRPFLRTPRFSFQAASKISPRDCQRVDFLFSRTACVYHARNVIS